MKAVYKWRLENGVYGYITDEQDASAFIYDQTTFEREYPNGTVISGTSVDEPLIANIISKKSKSEYTEMFNQFKTFVSVEYPDVAFLDVMYYYNVENDECSTSAGSLKCAGADVLFRVKDVTSGLDPKVTIEPINSNPENGDLTYDMSFVLPVSMASGGTTSFSALTSNTITVLSSITAEEFVKSGGTWEQYLMADGSVTVLSAGTNVTITTATTTYGKIVTINSSNTWRNIKVDNTQILDNSTASGLTLSAGTNVTLTTSNNGSYKVVTIKATDTNTWRKISVNDGEFLGVNNVSGLTLSAGTNVTLTTGTTNGSKVIFINSTASGGKIYQNGRNITIDGDDKINAEGYTFDSGITSVALFDTSCDTGLKFTGSYGNNGITVNVSPVGIINSSDTLIINNKEYKVNDVHDGPHYIIFTTTFDATSVTTNTKIYKIGQVELDPITSGNGILYDGGFLSITEPSKIDQFSVGDKIRHEKNMSVLYTVTEVSSTSQPIGLKTNPQFPSNTESGIVYKLVDNDRKNLASAHRSFATGEGTVAYKENMTVVGEYNYVENNPNKSDILFAVGNGTETSRGNAFIVRKDGSIHIHSTEDPSTSEHYGGRIDFGDGSGQKAITYIEESEDDQLLFNAHNFLFNCSNNSVYINDYGGVSATVNEVPMVKLGVPIGTVVMWPGSTAPSGWLLCNGDEISFSFSQEGASSKEQDLQGKHFVKNQLNALGLVVGNNYGKYGTLPDFRMKFPIGGTETKYEKMLVLWDDPNLITSKKIGDNTIYFSDIVDSSGNKTTVVPSWATNGHLVNLFQYYRDSTYNTLDNTIGKYFGNVGSTNDGEYRHKLTTDEMPSHTHTYDQPQGSGGDGTLYGHPLGSESGYDYRIKSNQTTGETGGGLTHNNVPPYLAVSFIIKYA